MCRGVKEWSGHTKTKQDIQLLGKEAANLPIYIQFKH